MRHRGFAYGAVILGLVGLLVSCAGQRQRLTGSVFADSTTLGAAYMTPYVDAAWRELGYENGMADLQSDDAPPLSDRMLEALVGEAHMRARELAEGKPCSNEEKYAANIDAGTEIALKSASGTIIGTTNLSPGTIALHPDVLNIVYCRFDFSMRIADTDSDSFTLLIAGDKIRTYTHQDLDETFKWTIDIHYRPSLGI